MSCELIAPSFGTKVSLINHPFVCNYIQQFNQQQMTILQIFRKDRKFWNEAEVEEIELFFMLHPFFSKFYEHEDFEKVVNFTFFTRLQENEEARLEVNKKSEIVILLSGEVKIYRKILEGENKKKLSRRENEIIHEQYLKTGEYRDSYQIIQIRNDVIVKSKPTYTSEFLFVPTMLYEAHNYIVNNRKLQRILEVLNRIFGDANKRDIKMLAESGCVFKEYKMNGYIYRAGSLPEACFILVSGNIKIQSAGFSAKKMLDMSIIGENSIFGDRDLNEEARTHNTICCSAHCKILIIKKEPYNRFISKNRHINPAYAEKLKSILGDTTSKNNRSILDKYEEKHVLPRIMRFHSYAKEEETQIEKGILQNCHILINLSPEKNSRSSFRLPEHTEKDYSISQFDRKLSMFKRRKSNRPLDLTNKLF